MVVFPLSRKGLWDGGRNNYIADCNMDNSISKKKIIYLDQFAVSEMMDRNSNVEWKEIKKLLLKAYKAGKIVCPTSSEHLIETVPKGFLDASDHDGFLSSLSDGLTYKSELLVVTQLISSRLRKNNKTLNTFFHFNTKEVLSNKKTYDELFTHNIQSKELMNFGVNDVNQIRKAVGSNRVDPKTKRTLYLLTKKLTIDKFIERLDDLLKKGQTVLRGDQMGNTKIPNWIDSIIWRLLNVHKFKKKDIIHLKAQLKRTGFDSIPTLDIRHSLKALISLYNKTEDFGDQIDISRISTGLPISDVLFTDKKRKSEIIELELDVKYKTKVLSGQHQDLCLFIDYLKKEIN